MCHVPAPQADDETQSQVKAAVAAEKKPEERIRVADELTDPHSLVSRTLRSLQAARVGDNGLARPRASKCLAVLVSPAAFDRAGRILNALIKALEARGYPVCVGGEQAKSSVVVLGETVPFRLEEHLDRRERPPKPPPPRQRHEFSFVHTPEPEYDYLPSGRLCLQIGHTPSGGYRRTWSDGKKSLGVVTK
jgi:hypothetical protein